MGRSSSMLSPKSASMNSEHRRRPAETRQVGLESQVRLVRGIAMHREVRALESQQPAHLRAMTFASRDPLRRTTPTGSGPPPSRTLK